MTKQALLLRKMKCQQDRLCFISLKPYSDSLGLVKHSDAGIVLVNKEFETEIDLTKRGNVNES